MFLSARSISQAYITRQFLINLKQVYLIRIWFECDDFKLNSTIRKFLEPCLLLFAYTAFGVLQIAGWDGFARWASCHFTRWTLSFIIPRRYLTNVNRSLSSQCCRINFNRSVQDNANYHHHIYSETKLTMVILSALICIAFRFISVC